MEPHFGSDRDIPLHKIAWEHDRHTTRAATQGLQQFDGRNMCFDGRPAWSAELNPIFQPYPKVQTVRDDGSKDTTPSYIEHVFDLEKKLRRHLI